MDRITKPQLNFITNILAQERDVPVAGRTQREAWMIARYEDCFKVQSAIDANVPESEWHFVSKREGSEVITWLMALPRKATAQPARAEKPAELTPGVYEVAGIVYVVKPTRDKQRLYAMRLVVINALRSTEAGERQQIDFEYDKGAIFKIQPEHRMPFERAKELTTLYGKCIVCARQLKAGKSVEDGIGPVCIKSFPDAKLASAKRGKVQRKVYETEFSQVA